VNAIEQARQAYAPSQFPLKSNRAVEAQLFAQVTARLRKATENSKNFTALAEALHANRQMWIALAVDLADDGNGLPDELRAQLFSLAAFSNSHSQKVLRNEETADALIDINMSVLRGLNFTEVK
jgi:flagellar protein FlaF